MTIEQTKELISNWIQFRMDTEFSRPIDLSNTYDFKISDEDIEIVVSRHTKLAPFHQKQLEIYERVIKNGDVSLEQMNLELAGYIF